MTETEFLETLRNSLVGEIPDYEIEENLRFYQNYIKNEKLNKKEEEVLNQLGNPRLIAKTIIETYQISHGPIYEKMRNNRAYEDQDSYNNTSYSEKQGTYYENVDDNRSNYNEDYDNKKSNYNNNGDNRIYNFTFNWVQKLLLILIFALIIILFIFIGAIVIRLLITFIIPILIIYFAIKIFRNTGK